MKIYLAARYSRHPEMQAVAEVLQQNFHVVTSTWINGNSLPDAVCAQNDLRDLLAADAVLSFTEEPRQMTNTRGGRHVEFGLALGFGKAVFIIGPRENVFHYLPNVRQFSSLIAFIEFANVVDIEAGRLSA
jgi:hypothetical protein